ncbi:S-layer homology domain-containing protein [Candidatus Gracilibacteria bacterium]|nr:S-layer homology domain-containing protein [Candidatus Gracilibacteria bacterium]
MKRLFFAFGLVLWIFTAPEAFAALDFEDTESIPEWSQNAIATLVSKQILSGNTDGTFAPDREMNRAEFCKVLVTATGVDKYIPLKSDFPDVERDDWFFEYVETAKHFGWVSGYPDGTFRPGNKINRAEAAKILTNAFELGVPTEQTDEAWYGKYFRALSENDLLAHGTSFEDIGSDKNPTRSEISEQIFRLMKKTGRLTAHDIVVIIPENESEKGSATDDISSSSLSSQEADNPPSFDYKSDSIQSMKIDADAGSLYVEKSEALVQRVNVKKNQVAVSAHELKLQGKNGVVEIKALQFRRVGNGIYSDFDDLWLEEGGRMISNRIKPTKEVVNIPLKTTLIVGSSLKKIVLKIDMSQTAKSGHNSRWVLYLPEWIDANTSKRIGFFPFGGADIVVE